MKKYLYVFFFIILGISLILNVIFYLLLKNKKVEVVYDERDKIIYYTNYIYKSNVKYIEKSNVIYISNDVIIYDENKFNELYIDYTNYVFTDVYGVLSNDYLILWHYKNTNIYKFNNKVKILKNSLGVVKYFNIYDFEVNYNYKDNKYLCRIGAGYISNNININFCSGINLFIENFYIFSKVYYDFGNLGVGVGLEYSF